MAPTILCADDDRNFCRILARSLREEGYEVETAHDGISALEQLKALRPGLVTLDVLLPRRDGFAVLEAIRSSPVLAETPVFLLSGCTFTPAYAKRAESLRADAVLQKPVPLERLIELVGKQVSPEASAEVRKAPMEGTLEEVPFPSLLHHLHGMRATGVLEVQQGKKRKQLQLRDGHPVAIRSNLVNETLGHLLVASGTISWDVMHESLRRVRRGEGLQGRILMAMQMLDEADLARALRNQAEEKLFEIFCWRRGRFRFHRGARVRSGNALSLSRSTADVIYDAILLRAPLSQADAFLDGCRGQRLVPTESPFYRFQELTLDDAAQALLARVERGGTIAELGELDEADRRRLYALLVLERVELRNGPATAGAAHAEPPPSAAPSSTTQRRATRAGAERIRVRGPAPVAAPSARAPAAASQKAPVAEPEVAAATEAARAPEPIASSAEDESHRQRLTELGKRFRLAGSAFEILGVRDQADDGEVRAAYAELAHDTHPDRFAGSSEAVSKLAEEAFGLLAAAYEAIRDRDRRLLYLRDLARKDRDQAELEEGHRALKAELEFQKGELELRARRYETAANHFQAAMRAYPEEGEYQCWFGFAHWLRAPEAPGRLEEAITAVRAGLKLAPDREKPYLFLGRLYKAADRVKAAEKMFTRAVQLDPDCVEALRELRLIHMRREKSKGLVRRMLRR